MLCITVTSVIGLLVLAWAWRMMEWLWLKPRRAERLLRAQGLRGRPYRPPFGDLREEGKLIKEARSKPISPISHCIIPRVSPFLHSLIQQYGKTSLTWFGPNPRVSIMDPELIREILSNKYGNVRKTDPNPLGRLLATGLVTYNGEKWATHRRIINPAFHQEKLKRMLPAFSTCCDELISRWENIVCSKGSSELDVWPELRNFSADAISRAAFGSSYKKGRYLFQLQSEQAELVIQAVRNLYIPGYRFLPTKKNNRRKQIYREVQEILRSMIQQRERAKQEGQVSGDDLLGLLIESNLRHSQEHKDSKKIGMTIEDVIEECKLFYFAGHETTSVLLTWAMILLSMNPSWQERAREEVLQVWGKNKPEFDDLARLKIHHGSRADQRNPIQQVRKCSEERPKPIGKVVGDRANNLQWRKMGHTQEDNQPCFSSREAKAFSTCCDELISRWENIVCSKGSSELDVWPELRNFNADVISRAAFGSSYKEGRYLFQLQAEQAELVIQAAQNLYIPGYRFLPTKKNNRRKQIYREIHKILRSMIQQRERAKQEGQVSGDDLLGLLIESNLRHSQEHKDSKNIGMTTEDVIEECKLFYFAGHETTSVLLTWAMILLSMNPS